MLLLSDFSRDDDDKHDNDRSVTVNPNTLLTNTDHKNGSSSSSSSSSNNMNVTTGDSKIIQSKKMEEDTDLMTKNVIAKRSLMKEHHPILISTFAFEIYVVLVLFLLFRRYWILHGITLLIIFHIAEILYLWIMHVTEAKEVRQFKSWLMWWIRIGLDFATRTVEGEIAHRVLTAYTLNFWNIIGKNYTINWFDDIAKKGRTNMLNQAKERLNQSKMNHKKFANSLRSNLTKRKSG